MRYLHITFLCILAIAPLTAAQDQPNILWIVAEDHGPHMGCYGDTFATTPNIDKLASKGMCYDYAWSNAPVCAAARTTLWSGIYGPSSGGEHMRSMAIAPEGKTMFPEFLREAGYYCTGNGKEDYNLPKPEGMWDVSPNGGHWKDRKGKPFFAYFNNTQSHESHLHKRDGDAIHDPKKVRVPAYHPDAPEIREEWARYYDSVTAVDAAAGKWLKQIETAGLSEDTIIFYFADHGSGMARNKRWPDNAGLRVPVVVYFPEKWKHLAPADYKPGGRSSRLISFVDFGPTVLSIAGIKPPEWMQGNAFAGKFQAPAPEFLHGFRGRMDERLDLVRSVFDGRYVYLRNYMPQFSQGQRVDSQIKLKWSSTLAWRKLYDAGKLNEAQSLFWKTPKDPEELYDLQNDPDEVVNLAASPDHQDILHKLRKAQQDHALKIRDVGFIPENERHCLHASPYDFARTDHQFPIERIIETADLASSMKPEVVPELQKSMADENTIIRYWSTMGMVIGGETAVQQSQKELLKNLSDPSPDVRISAAWAIAKFGTPEIAQQGLATLAELAPGDRNNGYIAMAALTALDDCGMKAAPLKEKFLTWSTHGEIDERAQSSCEKLMKSILIRFKLKEPVVRKKAKKPAKP